MEMDIVRWFAPLTNHLGANKDTKRVDRRPDNRSVGVLVAKPLKPPRYRGKSKKSYQGGSSEGAEAQRED